jgi:hypothetical protein
MAQPVVATTRIPGDLCPTHRAHFVGWRRNDYSPWNPTEWPGGSHIMDSRTSHEERARDWDRKNLQAMEQVAAICRSGRSPQCDHSSASAPASTAA